MGFYQITNDTKLIKGLRMKLLKVFLSVLSFFMCSTIFAADYTVSPEGEAFKAVDDGSGQTVFTSNKAHEVINWSIEQAGTVGGGTVHLVAGTYEISDFIAIIGDDENWVSARSDVTIDNNVTSELPPYQAQGSSVTKITINADSSGDQATGLIAYHNFDTPLNLTGHKNGGYSSMTFWLYPNKDIMERATTSSRFQITFCDGLNGGGNCIKNAIYHSEAGDIAIHEMWRGHKIPYGTDKFLPDMSGIKSVGIELIAGSPLLGDTETVIYLDDITAHNGQIKIYDPNVKLEGEGPYSTILKMKDYGNLPVIHLHLDAKNTEISYLQIHGNTDNAAVIDYSPGVLVPWSGRDFTGTKIHHNFIQQTQGASITMKGTNVKIYENLLTHSENPMVSGPGSQNLDIFNNTFKYCTNDAFLSFRYPSTFGNNIRNNQLWPISNELSNSNSPDNPVSYTEYVPTKFGLKRRFNHVVKHSILMTGSTHDHIVKDNVFYNMNFVGTTEGAGFIIQDGSNNITVDNNRFYNSNMTIRNYADVNNIVFDGNYFDNSRFWVANGYTDTFDNNILKNSTAFTLKGSGHTGSGNFKDLSTTYTNESDSEIGFILFEPELQEIKTGNSWEWGDIVNGGFEEGNSLLPDGWSTIGDITYTSNTWTSDPLYGMHGIKSVQTEVVGLNVDTAVDHISGWITESYIRVFPGETLTAQAIVKLENYSGFGVVPDQQGLRFSINYYKENGGPCSVSSEDIGLAPPDNDQWIRLKKDVSVPVDCSKALIGFYLTSANGKFTADEVKLYRKRTAKEITSFVSLDNASFENYTGILDDSVEDDFSNWGEIFNSTTSNAFAVSDSIDGVAALKIQHEEFTQSWVGQQVYTLEPSTNYYFEFWAKKESSADNDVGTVQLVDVYSPKVWLQDDLMTWGDTNNNLNALTITETEWTRKAINFKTPPAELFSGAIEIRLINNGSADLYLDNVRLYEGFGQSSIDESMGTPADDPDIDNDGIKDWADNCPSTPNSTQDDFDGDEIGDVCDNDIDGDGALNDVDCEAEIASIYPGAEEIYNDGIDQNCVNGDATITIFNASFIAKKGGTLEIEALTNGGQEDQLSVDTFGAMSWIKKQGGRWSLNRSPTNNPGTITIRGSEGYIHVMVQ